MPQPAPFASEVLDLFAKPDPYNPVTTDPKRESYAKLVPTLSEKRASVYWALRSLNRATAQQIADKLQYGVNRITGRLDELMKAGLVIEDGRKLNPSGRNVTAYRALELPKADS